MSSHGEVFIGRGCKQQFFVTTTQNVEFTLTGANCWRTASSVYVCSPRTASTAKFSFQEKIGHALIIDVCVSVYTYFKKPKDFIFLDDGITISWSESYLYMRERSVNFNDSFSSESCFLSTFSEQWWGVPDQSLFAHLIWIIPAQLQLCWAKVSLELGTVLFTFDSSLSASTRFPKRLRCFHLFSHFILLFLPLMKR